MTGNGTPMRIEFFFDPMCPFAYQTSVWIRDVRAEIGLDIVWRFFSLEETNRPEGKKHPWERELSYGWTPMRVAAWLRRHDMLWCDAFYEACGKALHVDGRRFYDRDVACELLRDANLPESAWDDALRDSSTHDDVKRDHDEAVAKYAGFGVPIIVIPNARAVFGPVVAPAPPRERAVELWNLVQSYASFPGLYEIKTPKTRDDLSDIGTLFRPYLDNREWPTIQTPAP
jgi:predicted DsbA family dithiol-disulfide isomerase